MIAVGLPGLNSATRGGLAGVNDGPSPNNAFDAPPLRDRSDKVPG